MICDGNACADRSGGPCGPVIGIGCQGVPLSGGIVIVIVGERMGGAEIPWSCGTAVGMCVGGRGPVTCSAVVGGGIAWLGIGCPVAEWCWTPPSERGRESDEEEEEEDFRGWTFEFGSSSQTPRSELHFMPFFGRPRGCGPGLGGLGSLFGGRAASLSHCMM